MKQRVLGAAVVAALSLSGCGGGEEPAATGTSTPTPARVCPSPQASQNGLTADLDGNGHDERVAVVAAGNACPAGLVAQFGSNDVRVDLPTDGDVANTHLSAVRLRDRSGALVLATTTHPRGGFQATLYAYANGTLAELSPDGDPLFPFVATDVLTTPLAATCAKTGFVVTAGSARASSWDVTVTTYGLSGTTLSEGPPRTIATDIDDAELKKRYRATVRHDLFENCPR